MLQELLTQKALMIMGVMWVIYVGVILGWRCGYQQEKVNKIAKIVALEGVLFVVIYHVIGLMLVHMGY
ncbi:MAG: hypothetical protein LVQ75_04335 [Candidatus Babeliales bacterium]|jgi:uncharacterized membrane protein (Fun14 family)